VGLLCYARLDQDLATFLESQPEIRDLSLRGMPACTSDPFTIPRSALPHLESFRSVHVDPDTLGEVSILVHPPTHLPESAPCTTHCLSCQIDSFGTGNRNAPRAGHLPLLILRARLSRARSSRADLDARPTLNNPHHRCVGAKRALPAARCAPATPRGTAHRRPRSAIQPRMSSSFLLYPPPVVLTVEGAQDTLLASAPLLEAFAGLRFLTFIASGSSCYQLDDEATVAEQWARACPTLTTIILPKGRVWFASSEGKWEHS